VWARPKGSPGRSATSATLLMNSGAVLSFRFHERAVGLRMTG
jgi:hypothetical protein